jgi:hypothetical protein
MVNKSRATTLYTEVVDITYNYLGPAADRFVARQIRNHLGKDPHQLKKSDLKDLINWIKVAVSLLSDDKKIVDRYIADLKRLTV